MSLSLTPPTLDLDPATPPQMAAAQVAMAPPELPKPPPIARQQLGARIPADLYKRLRVRAVTEDVLIQELVERAIVEFLDRGGPPCV